MDMKVAFFVPPTVAPREELQKGLAGRKTHLYQTMLEHLAEMSQYADEHGYYGMGFTEHHLNVEGMTLSNSPSMLGLYLADRTKNMRFGALGHVLPVHDPLRVAAEIAMLDQMSQGRAFAGFAKGVQTRWVNTMAQHRLSLADNITDPDQYNDDKRKLYYEHLEIILKAWDNDLFSHKGEFWTIPAPRTAWPGRQLTEDMAPESIDESGRLTQVGVGPPMYERQRPTMFEPFSASDKSIRTAAANGLVPIGIMCNKDVVSQQLDAAQQGWEDAGVKAQRGERMGYARYIVVGETEEEAQQFAELAMYEWYYFFAQFGFNAVLANPGENWRHIPNTLETFKERGILFCGTPDSVCKQLDEALGWMPVEYLWLFTANELLPQPMLMKHLELMTTRVLPNFTNTIKA